MPAFEAPSQAMLLSAMRDAAQPIPQGLKDGHGHPAGRRFNVYRNNIATSLTEAMRVGFPAIQSLIGPENFTGLARQFIQQHPPHSPLMIYYGDRFPEYLAQLEALRSYPYLPDIARLEWAQRLAYHAPDHTPVSAQELTRLTSEELMRARLELAPSVDTLSSVYPIIDIYRYALKQTADKPRAIAQCALILRPVYDPEIFEISLQDAKVIHLLQQGQSLESAMDHVSDDYDPSQLFHHLISHGAITHIISTKG